MTVLLSHSVVPLFFLTFDGSIVTLGNTNIKFDHTFLIFDGTLIFLTFDNSIVTLGNINITCDCTFVTFDGSFILFLTFDGSTVILGT